MVGDRKLLVRKPFAVEKVGAIDWAYDVAVVAIHDSTATSRRGRVFEMVTRRAAAASKGKDTSTSTASTVLDKAITIVRSGSHGRTFD